MIPKHWGRVSAKPSEYLIKLRKGKVVAHGPGLSVRLWPGETCTILPTSIQRTSFVADQVTSEKVGIAVTGIAVYRVAEPMVAFRMLDFTEPGGVEQLGEILREMFVGAARRLVASIGVEECLTRRKESIALELMREIQPVVSGAGRPEDSTDRGWGVVIDTIEIQDVRILSEKVFSDLQAPFRSRLELEARKSTVERDQEIHLREVAAHREMLEVDQQLLQRKSEAEEQRRLQSLAQQERLDLAQAEGEQRMAQTHLEAGLAERQRGRDLAEAEYESARQQAEQSARLEQQRAQDDAKLARQRVELEAEVERARLEHQLGQAELTTNITRHQAESQRTRGEVKVWLERQQREADNVFSDERLRYEFLTNALPALSEAFVKSLGNVHQTRFVSDRSKGEPGLLVETVAQLMEVARASGLDLGNVLNRNNTESQ
jgi:hypothetical protein